jgi:hypothetical protein
MKAENGGSCSLGAAAYSVHTHVQLVPPDNYTTVSFVDIIL